MTRPIKHAGPTTALNFVLTKTLKDEVVSAANMLTERLGKSVSAGDLVRAGVEIALETPANTILEKIGR